MGRILLSLFSLFFIQSLHAGSCCGQSPTSFTVLSLEQALSMTAAFSNIKTQGRILTTGEFYEWSDKKREIQAVSLGLASAFMSRHQVFATTALLRGEYSDEFGSDSSQHLADTQLGYTYEVLPEYSFSYWKPVIYISFLANVPTGRSIYDDSGLSEGAGVTGQNQWAYGLGLTIKKVYHPLSITLQLKSLKVRSKKFASVRVSSFFDNSASLLFSYRLSTQKLALNLGLTFNEITPRRLKYLNVKSDVMRSNSLIFGLSRPLLRNLSAGLSYTDQTLLGRPKNTLLNRTLTFNLNYNYF